MQVGFFVHQLKAKTEKKSLNVKSIFCFIGMFVFHYERNLDELQTFKNLLACYNGYLLRLS